MKSGPAASPSSQIVTKRTVFDLSLRPSRSSTTLPATGTIPMQANVLETLALVLGLDLLEVVLRESHYSHCCRHKRQEEYDDPSILLGPF